jgi:hypothetical protein
MVNAFRWSVLGLALLPGSLALGATAPLVMIMQSPAIATSEAASTFPDLQNHWSRPFVEALTAQNIIAGYPDGTFRPDNLMGVGKKQDELGRNGNISKFEVVN